MVISKHVKYLKLMNALQVDMTQMPTISQLLVKFDANYMLFSVLIFLLD